MSSPFTLDYLPPPTKDRFFIHCRSCEAVLRVSVPCCSVTVQCGKCHVQNNVEPSANQLNFGHSFFSPSHNLLEEVPAPPPSLLVDHCNPSDSVISTVRSDEPPKVPAINRPPEKRQRAPSAYNRFIRDEIQRIKAGNPDITHREAFSAAAKNWAPFSQNHSGQ